MTHPAEVINPPDRGTRWRPVAVAAVAAGLIGFLICRGCTLNVVRRPTLADLGECPHYWSRLDIGNLRVRPGHSLGNGIAPLSRHLVDVPEYHDCQRLLPQGSTQYGALAAIFASATLDSLPAELESVRRAHGKTMGVTAATVVAIDAPFDELGIRYHRGLGSSDDPDTLVSCLYMWRGDAGWSARMVPVADLGSSCFVPLDIADTRGTALTVIESATNGAGGFTHPAVARWEHSQTGQYIGIRCGTRWCSLGREGFQSSADLTPDVTGLDAWLATLPGDAAAFPATGTMLTDLALVRGWFDDQRLAPAGGGTAPSALRAVVLPHPSLQSMTVGRADATFLGKWQATGFVWIPDQGAMAASALHGYQDRFGFDAGWTAISLCNPNSDEASDDPLPSRCGLAVSPPGCRSPADNGEQFWYARIQARTGTTRHSCVLRRPHAGRISYGVHVIGTARWRWVRGDEWVWEACASGCCEVWRNDT